VDHFGLCRQGHHRRRWRGKFLIQFFLNWIIFNFYSAFYRTSLCLINGWKEIYPSRPNAPSVTRRVGLFCDYRTGAASGAGPWSTRLADLTIPLAVRSDRVVFLSSLPLPFTRLVILSYYNYMKFIIYASLDIDIRNSSQLSALTTVYFTMDCFLLCRDGWGVGSGPSARLFPSPGLCQFEIRWQSGRQVPTSLQAVAQPSPSFRPDERRPGSRPPTFPTLWPIPDPDLFWRRLHRLGPLRDRQTPDGCQYCSILGRLYPIVVNFGRCWRDPFKLTSLFVIYKKETEDLYFLWWMSFSRRSIFVFRFQQIFCWFWSFVMSFIDFDCNITKD